MIITFVFRYLNIRELLTSNVLGRLTKRMFFTEGGEGVG